MFKTCFACLHTPRRMASSWLVDHQVRPFAPLIPCVKLSQYGALTNTLEVELDATTLECDDSCQAAQNLTEINVDYTKVTNT